MFVVCEQCSYVSVTRFLYVYIFSKVRPECVLGDHLSVGQSLHEIFLILCDRPQRLHWFAAAPAIRSSWAARRSSPPPCSRFGSSRAHRAPVRTVGRSSPTYHRYFAPQLESSPRNPEGFVRYNFTPIFFPGHPCGRLGHSLRRCHFLVPLWPRRTGRAQGTPKDSNILSFCSDSPLQRKIHKAITKLLVYPPNQCTVFYDCNTYYTVLILITQVRTHCFFYLGKAILIL